MKIVDLNIVLYAVNEDSAHHAVSRAWWEQALNGDETVGLPWVVLLGFMRISTNARVFPVPLPLSVASSKVDAWLAVDNVAIVREKDQHWAVLHGLLERAGTAGNLTTDAHLAALALSHDATLASCDTDFARFEGLRWESPLR